MPMRKGSEATECFHGVFRANKAMNIQTIAEYRGFIWLSLPAQR